MHTFDWRRWYLRIFFMVFRYIGVVCNEYTGHRCRQDYQRKKLAVFTNEFFYFSKCLQHHTNIIYWKSIDKTHTVCSISYSQNVCMICVRINYNHCVYNACYFIDIVTNTSYETTSKDRIDLTTLNTHHTKGRKQSWKNTLTNKNDNLFMK